MVENTLHIGITFVYFEAVFERCAKGDEEKSHEVFTSLVKDASFKEAFCLRERHMASPSSLLLYVGCFCLGELHEILF